MPNKLYEILKGIFSKPKNKQRYLDLIKLHKLYIEDAL